MSNELENIAVCMMATCHKDELHFILVHIQEVESLLLNTLSNMGINYDVPDKQVLREIIFKAINTLESRNE